MAAANPFITTFQFSNPAHRLVKDWRSATATSWRAFAKYYAKVHGEARCLLANGQVLIYRADGDKVRQRTYTKVTFID